jgi:hypothetical protein
MPRAALQYYEKCFFQNKRFVLEAKIWVIADSRYPDGVKYSLVFIDTKTGRKVLLDNHQPKGHHLHLDDNEFTYNYVNDKLLIGDFKSLVFQHFGVSI